MIITQVAALSSPVSTVYARNAWDHDPLLWRLRTACLIRLGFPTEARVIMYYK